MDKANDKFPVWRKEGETMAIYHFTTAIVKASKGKCAVASAAYISGSKLYDERLGLSFNYSRKEEVVYTEILLPPNAPAEYKDRETLWNAVEKVQNKSNSRYARTFEMALPNELTTKEQIELARNFIKENFVDKGMAADFAIHKKEGNNHVHVMTTVRGFTKTGKWASMEKKDYARDKDGNRIPIIDSKTGLQKRGKKNDLQWKRVTVTSNEWNSRKQLLEWRKNWAEECNKYLPMDKHIDHRSYEEQGIEKIPTIHEGYAARQMASKGIASDRVGINEEIKHQNSVIEKVHALLLSVKEKVNRIKERLIRERDENEKVNRRKNRTAGATHESGIRTAGASHGTGQRIQKGIGVYESAGEGTYDTAKTEQRIAELKRGVAKTEQSIIRIKSEVTRRIKELNERIDRYRRNASDNGDAGFEDNRIEKQSAGRAETDRTVQTGTGKSSDGKQRNAGRDTEAFLRQIDAEIESARVDRQTRDAEQSRSDSERERETFTEKQRPSTRDDDYETRSR